MVNEKALSFRCSAKEKALLEKAARKMDMSINKFIRHSVKLQAVLVLESEGSELVHGRLAQMFHRFLDSLTDGEFDRFVNDGHTRRQ